VSDQELYVVGGSTPSEVEKEAAGGVGAEDVEAPASLDSIAPIVLTKKDRKC
jgi:hypothetical protein